MLLYIAGFFRIVLAGCLLTLAPMVHAQVIWNEPFNYPNGTTSGANNNTANPAIDWTSICPTCLSGDWFEVQGNLMEGRDTNGPATLETEEIDISAWPIGVEVSVALSESGDLEGCPGGMSSGCNSVDWIRIEYNLNGAGYQDWSSPNGGPCAGACAGATYVAIDDFNSMTFNVCPIVGNSLRLRISVQCWAAAEYMRIDDITVSVQTCNPFVNTTTVTNVSCNGSGDGSITVNASGAMAPYVYSLNGGPFQSGSVFNGLAPGTYTVIVRDVNGARDTLNNIVVTQPTAISFSDSVSVISCAGSSDGQIWALNASGGNPGYQYSLNGGAFQSGNSFTGLGPGSYDLVVQDQSGCRDTISGIVLTAPLPIAFSDSTVGITCFGSGNGEIWATGLSGGTPGYQYSLNGGPFQSTNGFTGLGPGTYHMIVEDSLGCRDTLTGLTISNPAPLTLIDSLVGISCAGASDGEIWLTNVLAGNPGFQYSLNGGPFQSGNSFTNLGPGNYTLIVLDTLGCGDTLSGINLSAPAPLSLSTGATPTGCTSAIGSVSVNVSGGTPGYSYQWNTNPIQTGATATGLGVGTYTVLVTDTNGCTATDSGTVTQPTPPVLTAAPDLQVCANAGGALLGGSVAGGTAPFSWSWSCNMPSCQLDSLTDDDPLANPAVNTLYYVQVTDSGGCVSNLDSILLTILPVPLADAGTDTIICTGDSTVLSGSGSGVGPQYDFDWSPAASLLDPQTATPTAFPGAPTWYSLSVTSGGCTSEPDSVFVDLRALPVAYAGEDTIICRGDALWLDAEGLGTGGTFSYTWMAGAVVINADSSDSVLVNPQVTTIYAVVASEDPGCSSSADSIAVVVEQPFDHPLPDPSIRFCPGEPLSIGVEAEAGYTYAWQPAIGLQDPQQALTMVAPEESMSYVLTVTNDTMQTENCRTRDFPVALAAGNCLMPNVITPNGDGVNDRLDFGTYFHAINLWVYDRWGNEVYQEEDYQNEWRGTSKGGANLPEGVYYYVLEANVFSGVSPETVGRHTRRSGELTLMR